MLHLDVILRRGDFDLEASATFGPGVTGLIGPNGAGKSTLLHCVAGLAQPDTGRITCDDMLLYDSGTRHSLPVHRRRIGVVFQDSRLLPHYTVRRNLEYAIKCTPRRERRFTLPRIVELLDLDRLLTQHPRSLSGGEQQRVAIGRTLLTSPRAVLLDEPLAAIDAGSRETILALLSHITGTIDIPTILVSHRFSDVLRLTDRLVMMDRGRCVAQGTYVDLLQQENLLDSLRHQGLANVWKLTVHSHDPNQGMTLLTPTDATSTPLDGRRHHPTCIKAPLTPAMQIGQRAHLVLRPQDVALALAPVEFISMQNQLAGQIERIMELEGQTFCIVNAGIPIITEVTHQTRRDLELVPGQRVWCLFKTHALRLFEAGQAAPCHESTPSPLHVRKNKTFAETI